MTRPGDEAGLNEYLRKYEQEIEIQALKLARIYCIDLHELLSRTSQTIWEKWRPMSAFEDDLTRYGYWLGIIANHSRNLSRKQWREWTDCQPASHQPERNGAERSGWRDPAIEALFKDEQFRIYGAISQLRGRSRDVMSLRALGRCDDEIRAELGMTPTNLSTTLSRARRELREILDMGRPEGGGAS